MICFSFSTKDSEAKTFKTSHGEVEVFMELVQPSVSLIIFGGGFDARPVSQLAKSLGWDVRVTDECVAHIAPLFFPTADKLSLCHRDFIDRDFEITPFTACVLMSHNYEYDRDVLKKLIKTDTPYIGILGPRKRFDKMLVEFRHKVFSSRMKIFIGYILLLGWISEQKLPMKLQSPSLLKFRENL